MSTQDREGNDPPTTPPSEDDERLGIPPSPPSPAPPGGGVEELRLEPPHVAPAPPAPERTMWQPPARPPAERPAPGPAAQGRQDDLQPGAGRPLVEGPPMSVSEPASDSTINRTAAFAGLGLLGIGAIVVVVLLLVIVFAVCTHH